MELRGDSHKFGSLLAALERKTVRPCSQTRGTLHFDQATHARPGRTHACLSQEPALFRTPQLRRGRSTRRERAAESSWASHDFRENLSSADEAALLSSLLSAVALSSRRRRRYQLDHAARTLCAERFELSDEDVYSLYAPAPFGEVRTSAFTSLREAGLCAAFVGHADAEEASARRRASRSATGGGQARWAALGARGREALRKADPATLCEAEAFVLALAPGQGGAEGARGSASVEVACSFRRLVLHSVVGWYGAVSATSRTLPITVVVRAGGAGRAHLAESPSCAAFVRSLRAVADADVV